MVGLGTSGVPQLGQAQQADLAVIGGPRCSYVCQGLLFFTLEIGKILVG